MRIVFLALLAFCCFGSAAQAQEFPPVFVWGEKDDNDDRACQVSYASIIAAVESELRYNRIQVGTREQFRSDQALSSYVRATMIVTPGGCVVSYSFQLENIQPVVISVTGKAMTAAVEICSRGGLISAPTYELQSRVNAAFRDYTAQCISEYRKK